MDVTGKVELPDWPLEQLEREAIEQRLARHGGNVTKAAVSLGISRKTIQRKQLAWREADNRASQAPTF